MPRIVEYKTVLQALKSQGLVSLYHNSGAFGFPRDAKTQAIGWIGPDDPTIRDDARILANQISEPHAEKLADLLVRAWFNLFPGVVWVMPMSHWAYELDFASRAWLPIALRNIDVDPALLESRNDASAIEFVQKYCGDFEELAEVLLSNLKGSDFAVAFPGHAALCTIHHHMQLWWTTSDEFVAQALRGFPRTIND